MKRKYLAIVLLISFALSMMCLLVGCHRCRYYPKEGVWYCEEYQIQISFEYPDYKSYVTVNDVQVECICTVEHGSQWLELSCREEDNPDADHYQLLFYCKFISLTENKLVVQDKAGTRYVFVRVNESEVPFV